ncbi:MAG: bifunctional precorrin-2 dehydrogenase/sirohydrochlorin ferrochelatase [Caulobacterales bacterium]|nr:bifunctional precorrin-2 dehydrogenase/sirohydrochlorin ferrochelatase [Caulobacterales bacterium]
MDAFPAFFPLAGRTVVIAGEGEAAEAKARLFEGSPATIVRLTGAEALDPRAYAGASLAFVAAEDDGWARAAAEAARAAGVPVNAVDRPALCDFTTPAVIDRGEVVAAIGTGGASPMLATMLRHDIEARVPEGTGRIAALFRLMQDEVRGALPDAHARRRFLRAALNGPAAEAAVAGDMEGARERLRAALFDTPQLAGRVLYVDARGPADLLTLRAARALAAADVLACDPEAHADVLALARRDAERLEGVSVAELVDLAAEGLHVARLITGSSWRTEQAALDAAGVSTEVLPIAS